MLGMFEKFMPKFAKKYTNLRAATNEAVTSYVSEVKEDVFPASENSFFMEKETLEQFMHLVERDLDKSE
jgi:3-methyl-2-oxobutanoate hydroxymethyltransferase